LTITAPAAGFVYITGSYTVWNSGCTTVCWAVGYVHHIEDNTFSTPSIATPPTSYFNAMGLSWVFPVSAGVNTFDIRTYRGSGDGTVYGYWGMLSAIYSPFGSTGGSTLGPGHSVGNTHKSN